MIKERIEKKKRKYGEFCPIDTFSGSSKGSKMKFQEKFHNLYQEKNPRFKSNIEVKKNSTKEYVLTSTPSLIKFDSDSSLKLKSMKMENSKIKIKKRKEDSEDNIRIKGSCDESNIKTQDVYKLKKDERSKTLKHIRGEISIVLKRVSINNVVYRHSRIPLKANFDKRELIFSIAKRDMIFEFKNIIKFEFYERSSQGIVIFYLTASKFPIVGVYSEAHYIQKRLNPELIYLDFCRSLSVIFHTVCIRDEKDNSYSRVIKIQEQLLKQANREKELTSNKIMTSSNKNGGETKNSSSSSSSSNQLKDNHSNSHSNNSIVKAEQLINLINKPLLNGKKNEELLIYPFKGIDSVIITTEDIERARTIIRSLMPKTTLDKYRTKAKQFFKCCDRAGINAPEYWPLFEHVSPLILIILTLGRSLSFFKFSILV